MDQFAQGVRHFADSFTDRIGSISHLTTAQLLWGLMAAAVLLPAAAYVWWLNNSAAFSVSSNDLSSKNTAVKIEQPAPAKIDTELHAETDGTAEPASSQNSSEASNNNAQNINVHVNGEKVPMPPSGTIHKEILSQGGNTSVDISVESNATGTAESQSNTSMNIELNSTSHSVSDDAD